MLSTQTRRIMARSFADGASPGLRIVQGFFLRFAEVGTTVRAFDCALDE